MRAIRWIEEGKYATPASFDGALEVILPSDATRLERWERVLAWYSAHTEFPHRAAAAPGAIVIAIGERFDAAGRYYAHQRQMRFATGSRLDDLGKLAGDAEAVTIFAPPERLTANAVREIRATLPLRLSLATARDLAGCSFLVAKLLLGELMLPEVGWIDAVYRSSGSSRDGKLDAQEFSRNRTLSTLTARDHRTLLLLAHGEGAHANLHDVVLCGHLGGEEHTTDGVPVLGCNGDRCKRVHRDSISMVPWSDLRCGSLALLSCFGFSVAGEQYPSHVSAVLSAVDGYVCEMLVTDRAIPYEAFESRVFASALVGGATLDDLAFVKNEIHERGLGVRPYFMIGGHPSTSSVHRHVSGFAMIPAGRASVVEVGGCLPQMAMRSSAYVWLAQPSDAAAHVIDRDPARKDVEDLLERSSHRLQRAEHIEHAIDLLYPNADRAPGNPIAEPRAAMSAAHHQIGRGVAILHHLVNRSHARGIWEGESVSGLLRALRKQVDLWDLSLARTLHALLLEGALLEDLPKFGLPVRSRSETRCWRCGSFGILEERSRVGDACCVVTLGTCPICGFLGAWPSTLGRHRLNLPATLSPAGVVELSVEAPADMDLLGACGSLSLHAKDKSRGRTFFERLERLSPRLAARSGLEEVFREELALPKDLSADLHTFYGILVRGMDFAITRERRPCIVPLED